MATATWSGYQAEAQTVAFSGTQGIDSLTNDEWTSLSDEVDNSTNKYLFADIELYMPSVAFTGADSAMELYIVPSVDGTNYPNWTDNVTTDEQENNIHFVGSMPTSGTTANQRLVLRAVALPPGKFKFAVRNRGGVTLTTGNTLKYRPYGYSAA